MRSVALYYLVTGSSGYVVFLYFFGSDFLEMSKSGFDDVKKIALSWCQHGLFDWFLLRELVFQRIDGFFIEMPGNRCDQDC
jgi:hypothetical protein